jgi:hypothetical protein
MRLFVPLAASLTLALAPIAAAQLTVVAIDPPLNSGNRAPNAEITVDFDRPVALASLSSFGVFGSMGGAPAGTKALENGGTRIRFRPARPWFAGEVVTIGMSHSLQAVDASFLRAAGYVSSFRVRAAPAPMIFTQTDSFYTDPGNFTRIYGGQQTDFDGDDSIDLGVVSEVASDVRVFKNRGDGSGLFVTPNFSVTGTGSTPSPNENGDMNGDGRTDVITCNTAGNSVSVLLGNGDGSFQPASTYPMGSDPRGIAVLDVDGDGDLDVVTANNGGNDVSLALNNGAGVLGAPSTFEGGGNGEFALNAADMNNDGITDLVVGLRFDQTIRVHLGNGNGTFTPLPALPAGGQPWMIVCGDLNADGNVDVSIAGSFSNTGSILWGNGDGTVQAPITVSTASFLIATDLGDLDGDGDLDWVLSSFGGQEWIVYRNDGGAFTFVRNFTTPANPACAGICDIDDDRDLDLVLFTETSDEIRPQRNGPLTHATFCYGLTGVCPCANAGQAHAGCDNSFATGGGRLVSRGIARVTADTLALDAGGLPPTVSTLFYQGTAQQSGGLGAAFGDGLRCVSGTVIRLGTKVSATGFASYGAGNASDVPISIRGAIPGAGATRHYQSWYRNAAAFCSIDTFNLTNGVSVTWTP